MKAIKIKHQENDLFVYFQKVRLEKAYSINSKKLADLEPKNAAKPTLFEKTKKFIANTTFKYEKKDVTIENDLKRFDQKHLERNIISHSKASELSFELFSDDKYGLSKLLFAISVILDDEYEYKYKEEGLREVSSILYKDQNMILDIKDSLESHYKKIANKGLSSVQKGILIGTAALSLVGIITLPILLGGGIAASASTTTALVAAHGIGDLQLGLGAITVEALLLGAAFTGAAYGGMKLYNSSKIREEFKLLSPEKNALFLAIQCTHIEMIKDVFSDREFNDILDDILKNLNTLKGDLDYFLFVEKNSVKDNKEKLKSFHEFDKELLKILEI